MRQLTKGMYADLNCKEFGISYGQHRSDDVIRNAGWFNDLGEKLGYGDLSIGDLDFICAELRDGEYFIALSEANTVWNMPSHLEKSNPGIQYVMDHAAWLCTNADLYKITNPPGGQEKYYESVGNYYEIKRESLFETLKFENGKFNSKVGIIINEVIPGNFYGLDEYVLSNGERWAVGHDGDIVRAAKIRAGQYLHKFGANYIAQVISLDQNEMAEVQRLIDNLDNQSHYLINRILGNDMDNYLDFLAKQHQFSVFGTGVFKSEIVPGLPVGYKTISISCCGSS